MPYGGIQKAKIVSQAALFPLFTQEWENGGQKRRIIFHFLHSLWLTKAESVPKFFQFSKDLEKQSCSKFEGSVLTQTISNCLNTLSVHIYCLKIYCSVFQYRDLAINTIKNS